MHPTADALEISGQQRGLHDGHLTLEVLPVSCQLSRLCTSHGLIDVRLLRLGGPVIAGVHAEQVAIEQKSHTPYLVHAGKCRRHHRQRPSPEPEGPLSTRARDFRTS